MNRSNAVDLCSDDEIGESNAKDGSKELISVFGMSRIKEKYKIRRAKRQKSKHQPTIQESKEITSPNAFITGRSNSSVLDQGFSPVHDSGLSSAYLECPAGLAPICRQFWKAGNCEMEQGQAFKATNQKGKNHMCIHPMFLHSNATSHKWAFGAIAELLDNAVDEIQNGATFVIIDKISNPRDGSPALVIQDDGGGMDPEAMRRCMSFGYSNKKSEVSIGQYGNGFKTSSMRLGADVIVFSRCSQTRTQSIGLLSYTFLRKMGYDRIVVPMVDYDFNPSTGTVEAICPNGNHGTKIVIYNLWLNDYGDMELDFDSEAEDIRINEDSKLFQADGHMKPIFNQHIANMYHHSLRVYSSILYMRLPQCFRIMLRGRVVEHHNIASDLKFPEFILYRPQIGGNMQAAVITSIGFLKEVPHVNIHGFNIYHRNRLILPFWRALKNTTNSNGRGVVGVLEANFIEPTHNKQDFEKTSLFQKLDDRLKHMTLEYWELHCELIGYQQVKRTISKASASPKSLSSRTISCQEHQVPMNHGSPITEGSSTASHADGSLQELTMKKEHNPPEELVASERQTRSTAYTTDTMHNRLEQPGNHIENRLQDQETANLIQENKRLRSQLLKSEEMTEELNQKVKRLRNELEVVQQEYSELLAELKSMDKVEGKIF